MTAALRLFRRLKLRHLLFLLLFLSGSIPLGIISYLLIQQNRELLETQEKSYLTTSTAALSREVSEYLASTKRQLEQLGAGLLTTPGPTETEARLREPWIGPHLATFLRANPNLLALRVLDANGAGPRLAPPGLSPAAETALDSAFEQARSHGEPIYRFTMLAGGEEPVAALAVPVLGANGLPQLYLEALMRLRLVESIFEREAHGDVGVFLVDRDGKLLWSEGANPEMQSAVGASDLVRDFARKPLNLTAEYEVDLEGRRLRMLARVSPVEESGWGVVVHKPASAAFDAVRRMIASALAASLLLALLALLIALVVARWVGAPIQKLAQATHDIAAGNFGRRLEEERMAFEVADLAADFNRMSLTVQQYVERLERAAQANRDLFISSIRAFAAAIDAKDPYTRGHSERVAMFSRVIAKQLGQNEELQQRVWIAALLHDVGKIGIEDRILKKGGVLTGEEYDAMKQHPTIGADILAPIEPLREMLPAIRWHHESWNGRGYPDALRGEAIPLIARIVAVADCFDAITTNRPYQRAYAAPYAVETITKLAGTRFDAKVVTAFLRAFESGQVPSREAVPVEPVEHLATPPEPPVRLVASG